MILMSLMAAGSGFALGRHGAFVFDSRNFFASV
jgi:hypothetical protein